ncbi:hypothetical protein [Clostridium hydrogeniformans]|uniref:hypothetical protein n=1 Tax=Clostridium hydrogeniformans TaxID=349933 RepID=UPI0006922B4B|nr:hypothetical protein [Clostridium hydrogeniformans]
MLDNKDIDSSDKYDTTELDIDPKGFITEMSYGYDMRIDSNECCYDVTKEINFPPCKMIKNEFLDVQPSCDGRLLIIKVNLKNICPNKKIAVGVLIYKDNRVYAFRAKKIDTGNCSQCICKNFNAGEFCFVFTEDNLCEYRKIKIKVIVHYINC